MDQPVRVLESRALCSVAIHEEISPVATCISMLNANLPPVKRDRSRAIRRGVV